MRAWIGAAIPGLILGTFRQLIMATVDFAMAGKAADICIIQNNPVFVIQ